MASTLEGQRTNIENDISDLETRKENLLKEREDLEAKLSDLGDNINNIRQLMAKEVPGTSAFVALTDEQTRLSSQIPGIENQISGKNIDIIDLDGRIAVLNDEKARIDSQIYGTSVKVVKGLSSASSDAVLIEPYRKHVVDNVSDLKRKPIYLSDLISLKEIINTQTIQRVEIAKARGDLGEIEESIGTSGAPLLDQPGKLFDLRRIFRFEDSETDLVRIDDFCNASYGSVSLRSLPLPALQLILAQIVGNPFSFIEEIGSNYEARGRPTMDYPGHPTTGLANKGSVSTDSKRVNINGTDYIIASDPKTYFTQLVFGLKENDLIDSTSTYGPINISVLTGGPVSDEINTINSLANLYENSLGLVSTANRITTKTFADFVEMFIGLGWSDFEYGTTKFSNITGDSQKALILSVPEISPFPRFDPKSITRTFMERNRSNIIASASGDSNKIAKAYEKRILDVLTAIYAFLFETPLTRDQVIDLTPLYDDDEIFDTIFYKNGGAHIKMDDEEVPITRVATREFVEMITDLLTKLRDISVSSLGGTIPDVSALNSYDWWISNEQTWELTNSLASVFRDAGVFGGAYPTIDSEIKPFISDLRKLIDFWNVQVDIVPKNKYLDRLRDSSTDTELENYIRRRIDDLEKAVIDYKPGDDASITNLQTTVNLFLQDFTQQINIVDKAIRENNQAINQAEEKAELLRKRLVSTKRVENLKTQIDYIIAERDIVAYKSEGVIASVMPQIQMYYATTELQIEEYETALAGGATGVKALLNAFRNIYDRMNALRDRFPDVKEIYTKHINNDYYEIASYLDDESVKNDIRLNIQKELQRLSCLPDGTKLEDIGIWVPVVRGSEEKIKSSTEDPKAPVSATKPKSKKPSLFSRIKAKLTGKSKKKQEEFFLYDILSKRYNNDGDVRGFVIGDSPSDFYFAEDKREKESDMLFTFRILQEITEKTRKMNPDLAKALDGMLEKKCQITELGTITPVSITSPSKMNLLGMISDVIKEWITNELSKSDQKKIDAIFEKQFQLLMDQKSVEATMTGGSIANASSSIIPSVANASSSTITSVANASSVPSLLMRYNPYADLTLLLGNSIKEGFWF